ncbi:MAG TPA: cell division protein FtsQ/DivIB [Moraxellaceae bacterium]|nr:cell division protein FtsQ/DivIB [Moraxellaceae bacterium]
MLQATRRTVEPAGEMPKLRVGNLAGIASRLLFAGAAVLLVVTGYQAAGVLERRAAIRSVQVEGDLRHASRAGIAERVLPLATGSWFSVDLEAIRQAALAAPWVDEVVVSRRWPDGVRLQVQEKQPVALWGAGGLISSRGDLFVPGDLARQAVDTEHLPILFGPGNKGTYVMEQYRAMNGVLRGIDMRIVELQLTDRMSWFLRLDNGIQLVVDQADTIGKLQRFAYLYERQLKPDAANIATIDLRYRNGVAVGWRVPQQNRAPVAGA